MKMKIIKIIIEPVKIKIKIAKLERKKKEAC